MGKTTFLLVVFLLIACDSTQVSSVNNVPQDHYKPYYEIKGMGIAKADANDR